MQIMRIYNINIFVVDIDIIFAIMTPDGGKDGITDGRTGVI